MHAEQDYLFRHALVRAAAYELQPPSTRAALHGLALEIMLAAHDDQPPGSVAAELAEHAGHALEHSVDTPRLRELRARFLKQAMTFSRDGYRLHETIRHADSLSSLSWIPADLCSHAILVAAEYCDRSGQRERAESYLQRAIELLEHHDLPERSYKAHMLMAVIRIHQGKYEKAEQSLNALIVMGPEVIGELPFAVALGNLAIVHREIGRNDQSEQEYRDVIVRFQKLGEAGQEGRNLGNLANLLRDRGEQDEAESAFRRGLELVRKADDKFTEGIILGNYAEHLIVRGRYAEARERIAAAKSVQQKLGDLEGEAQAHSHLARVLAGEGNLEAGIRAAREAVAKLLKAESPLLAAGARYSLARMLMEAGDLDAAHSESAESEQTLATMGARELLLCHVAPLRIEIAIARGANANQKQQLAVRLQEAEQEMKRLSLGPNSLAAKQIARCRLLLFG